MSRRSKVPSIMHFHCKQCWKSGRQTSFGTTDDDSRLNSKWSRIAVSGYFLVIGCIFCQNENRYFSEYDVLNAAGAKWNDDFIRVWEFDKAPPLLQLLSPHGGDEDWVALLPPGMAVPFWMGDSTAFARFESTEHKIDNWTLVFGVHG